MTPRLLLVSAALALAPMTAPAQELASWDEVEGWDIRIDPTLGNGCLIQAEFEDGSLVRIGLDRTRDAGYVTAFNGAWGDIEEGAEYPISFDLDGQSYDGTAVGLYLNDVPGADITFDNADFLIDIAARQTMTLHADGTEVMAIDLTGSAAALESMFACQDEQG
jgi:hypothetical protein